ncbi:hypothetical protein MUB15_12440 [Priestia sp. OVS21]|nr:hypothetical protein [Priestia sp. OVS21]
MGLLMITAIITLSVILDYFIFDYDDKHWGWLKKLLNPLNEVLLAVICLCRLLFILL